MARLCIADPPYPPQFSVRFDTAALGGRVTARSRATRWYGDHPDAADFDDLTTHRQLIEHLAATYDGWALATTPDGLGAYHPLPVDARVMAWVRSRPMPGGQRLISSWEAVIVLPPVDRRARDTGPRVNDVLVTPAPKDVGFVGSKPPTWTRWVLDALGHDPDHDTVDDMFPGSGSVAHAISQGVLL